MIVAVLFLSVALASAPQRGGDPSAAGRRALQSLEYEKALKLLKPVAADDDVADGKRAVAWVLVGQAHFGIAGAGAEERARLAFRQAFKLDIDVELPDRDDVSPKLVELFDQMCAAALKQQARSAPRVVDVVPEPEPEPEPEPAPPVDVVADPAPALPWSPWWIGAGAAGAVAVVAAVVVVGTELRLSDVPPGTSADDVKATQRLGVASVIVTAASATVALVAGTIGIATSE